MSASVPSPVLPCRRFRELPSSPAIHVILHHHPHALQRAAAEHEHNSADAGDVRSEGFIACHRQITVHAGNPFTSRHRRRLADVQNAYDDLLRLTMYLVLSVLQPSDTLFRGGPYRQPSPHSHRVADEAEPRLWRSGGQSLPIDPGRQVARRALPSIAAAHGVELHHAHAAAFTLGQLAWLLVHGGAYLRAGRRLALGYVGGEDGEDDESVPKRQRSSSPRPRATAASDGGHQHAASLAGAIWWLASGGGGAIGRMPPLAAGDWLLSDICAAWPAEIGRELASFVWPIESEPELHRLMALRHAAPVAIMGGEFTAACRQRYTARYRRVAISVDTRRSLVAGPHVRLDLRRVLMLCVWRDAFLFPPCTHQVLSDTNSREAKRLDGRTFWGVAFFVYCWCARARRLLVEQPATIIPELYLEPTQSFRPCDVEVGAHGVYDEDNKPICLYERGRGTVPQVAVSRPGASGHGELRDFPNAEARDRWRSSWERFPAVADAVVAAEGDGVDEWPVYAVEIERLAAAWYDRGLPVPHDYASPDARPVDASTRAYQEVRGRGDGRRVAGVVPLLRQRAARPAAARELTAPTLPEGPSCLSTTAPAAGPRCPAPASPTTEPSCSGVPNADGPAASASRAAGGGAIDLGLSGPSLCSGDPCQTSAVAQGSAGGAPRGFEPSPSVSAPGSSTTTATLATLSAGEASATVLSCQPDGADRHLVVAGAGAAITAASLPEAFAIDATRLTASCVVLVMVALQTVPLVLAYLDGFRLVGFDLAVRPVHAVAAAEQLAEVIIEGAGPTTFTAGRTDNYRGATVFTSPVAYTPPPAAVAATVSDRHRRRRAGQAVAWVTLAALAGTPAGAISACAVWAASALSTEVGAIPTLALPGAGGVFRFGVTAIASLVDRPAVPLQPTHAEATLMRSIQEGGLLRDLLLDTHEQYFADWAARIQPPEMAEFPAGLLDHVTSFTDASMGRLPFPRTRPTPRRARTPRKPKQLPTDLCPRSARDILYDHEWRRAMRWVTDTANDLACIRDLGDACERRRPPVLVMGQSAVKPPYRGYVWDFRDSPAECGRPLDFHAPLSHTLNVDFFRRRLRDYPNQHILGFIEDGVLYDADVELQTVLVPHLMSLSKGYASVVKELNRMASPELQWYTYHADFPFWPMYSLGEGCVPRKLEDRWRRCEEGGGPRKDVFDSDGVRALSLNEASRTHHFPQYYAQDTRPEWLEYLRQRQMPATPEMIAAAAANRGSKWAKQYMPDLAGVMKAMTVLKHLAHLIGEAVYIFGDDAKDYFNHLVNAGEELWKLNTIFLDGGQHLEASMYMARDGSKIAFIQERRMGFGLHPNSNIAQELSEMLLDLLREDVDAEEDPIMEADPRPTTQAWLEERRGVEEKHGGHQRRPYHASIYCDDNIVIVVGAARAVRILRKWRALTTDAGLLMAIPEKRSLGVWGLWIGALIFATIGVVAIPKQKTLRATQAVTQLLSTAGLQFGEYRSLIGLLEHLRCITRLPRRAMHGLYAPHGADGESRDGPNAIVRASLLMVLQMQQWLDVLGRCSGCSVAAALRRADLSTGLLRYFVASSDAATDSEPPGLGGFMHGFWWRIELTHMYVVWLHITVLELLASGFSAIIFAPLVPPANRLLLQMDATSAFYTLAHETERSPVLMYAHHRLLESRAFAAAAERSDAAHLGGSGNIAGDAASRSYDTLLAEVARRARVRLIRLEAVAECRIILDDVLAFARARGLPVRPNDGRPPPPPVPISLKRLLTPLESFRGKRRRNNEEKDHPSTTLLERLRQAEPGRPSQSSGSTRSESLFLSRAAAPATAPTRAGGPLLAALSDAGVGRKRAATSPPTRPPQRMATVAAAGVPLAAPSYSRNRAETQRTRDIARVNCARAQEMAGSSASAEQISRIQAGLDRMSEMTELGASARSLDKDDHAWDEWTTFSALYSWDPIVPRDLAVSRPDILISRLGLFLLWVYPRLVGRRNPDANPRSALGGYPVAIARILKRDHKLPVPKGTAIETEAKGLLRSYLKVYGAQALAPKRRQPMTREIWGRVEALVPGAAIAGRTPWMQGAARHDDIVGLRLGRVLRCTAHRVGEIVSYHSEEITYLTRSCVTYVIGGVTLVDPSLQQIQMMRPGDLIHLAPCPSKADQFGEEHCAFPSVLEYDGTEESAAGSLRAIEMDTPCRGHARRTTPLFANRHGRPYSYATLNRWLHTLMVFLVGAGLAACLSWHSCRIWLAMALRAGGASDAVIQLICRWKSPASVQTYAQLGITMHIPLLHKAQRAEIDAVRAGNIPELDNSAMFAQLMRGRTGDAAHARARAVSAAADGGNAGPVPAPLLQSGDRVEVLWGDEYFAGAFTSSKADHAQRRRLHRIMYDRTAAWPPKAHWHDLAQETWRRI